MSRGGLRVGSGRPKTRRAGQKKGKATTPVKSEPDQTPLEYMLAVMRDSQVDEARRDRMAVAAAGYVHEKADSKRLGKKEQREEAAKQSSNVYALNRAKIALVVDND